MIRLVPWSLRSNCGVGGENYVIRLAQRPVRLSLCFVLLCGFMWLLLKNHYIAGGSSDLLHQYHHIGYAEDGCAESFRDHDGSVTAYGRSDLPCLHLQGKQMDDNELCANPETDDGPEPPERSADRRYGPGVQCLNSRFLETHAQGASKEAMEEATKSADGPLDYAGGSSDPSGPGDSFRRSIVFRNLTGGRSHPGEDPTGATSDGSGHSLPLGKKGVNDETGGKFRHDEGQD